MRTPAEWLREYINNPDREETIQDVIRAIQRDAARDAAEEMRERYAVLLEAALEEGGYLTPEDVRSLPLPGNES